MIAVLRTRPEAARGWWAALVACLLLLAATPAFAQTFPELTGRVVDQAGIIDADAEMQIESTLEDFETRSGRQVVVATVNSLEGREPQQYATALGRHWQIGSEDKDDGVVLLVAPKEREVFIATGYGADDYLTDAMSGIIIRQAIIPRFKQGDFAGGIQAGVDRIIAQLELPPEEARARAEAAEQVNMRPEKVGLAAVIPVLVIMFVFFTIIGSLTRAMGGKRYRGKKGKRRRGGVDPLVVLWGLDLLTSAARGSRGGGFGGFSGGGGFGGFSGGGGSFGGGGAGGSW